MSDCRLGVSPVNYPDPGPILSGITTYRNGPERTETDTRKYRHGLLWYGNGPERIPDFSGYEKGPEQTSAHTETNCNMVENVGTNDKQTDLILLDFTKAFDKVNHLKLLYKLQMHGVQGKTLSWVQSFFVGRTQSVVLEGECSDEVPVSSGVPQGYFISISRSPSHKQFYTSILFEASLSYSVFMISFKN